MQRKTDADRDRAMQREMRETGAGSGEGRELWASVGRRVGRTGSRVREGLRLVWAKVRLRVHLSIQSNGWGAQARFEQGLRGGFSGVSHVVSHRMDTVRGTSGQPGMGRGRGPRLTAWWVPMRTGEAASCCTLHTFPAEQVFFFFILIWAIIFWKASVAFQVCCWEVDGSLGLYKLSKTSLSVWSSQRASKGWKYGGTFFYKSN